MAIGDSKKAMEDLKKIRLDHAPWFAKYVRPQDANMAVAQAHASEQLFGEKPEAQFLCADAACMACFYYAMCAERAYELYVVGHAQYYEGELDSATPNFRALFESIAFLYGVAPAKIEKHWKCVEMQITGLGLPIIPDEERYRFNRVPELKLN